MERLETRLKGPILLAPTAHDDRRGFFLETYRQDTYADLGINDEFVQDNHSLSTRGIVRGMHFQPGQSKLVRCARALSSTWSSTSGGGRRRSASGRRSNSTTSGTCSSMFRTGSRMGSAS